MKERDKRHDGPDVENEDGGGLGAYLRSMFGMETANEQQAKAAEWVREIRSQYPTDADALADIEGFRAALANLTGGSRKAMILVVENAYVDTIELRGALGLNHLSS